ncbi:hypothetical protein D3C84_950310 [compost metagenome]
MVVDQFYGLGEVGYPDASQDRPENFLAVDTHVWCDVVEQCGAQPVTVLKPRFGGCEAAAVDYQLSASLHALVDVVRDTL